MRLNKEQKRVRSSPAAHYNDSTEYAIKFNLPSNQPLQCVRAIGLVYLVPPHVTCDSFPGASLRLKGDGRDFSRKVNVG